MSLQVKFTQEKYENKHMKSFIEFYLSRNNPDIKSISIKCIPETHKRKTPDYFIKKLGLLVEVKQVVDRDEIEYSAIQWRIINLIKKELKDRDLSFLRGSYRIYTSKLKSPKNVGNIVDEILNAISLNQTYIQTEVGRLEIEKISNEGQIIGFGNISPVITIVDDDEISKNIKELIPKANEQLGSLNKIRKWKIKKRILLFVNKSLHDYDLSSFYRALARFYNELLTLSNIDEIWLQMDNGGKEYFHSLLYTKDFLTNFDKNKIQPDNKEHIWLFEKWFSSMYFLEDGKYRERLFSVLKKIVRDKQPYKVFEDCCTISRMLELGSWLAGKNKFDDAIWIIDKFLDNPVPEDNYLLTTKSGEVCAYDDILAFLGNFVICKLACNKRNISRALVYVEQLLKHKNPSVKSAAASTLYMIASNRQWLKGWGKRPRKSEYKKFHKLVFDLLDYVEQNPNYKNIVDKLVEVFGSYTDLSTKEANRVLDILKVTENSAGLFTYFGIFRKLDYKDLPIKFNEKVFERKLREMIINDDEKYSELRNKISWRLFKIVESNKDNFNLIVPFVDLFLEKPFKSEVVHFIMLIIKDNIANEPEICVQWLRKILKSFVDLVKKGQNTQHLFWFENETIMETIARLKPEYWFEICHLLLDLEKNGINIGNKALILKSFEFMSDGKEKEIVKAKLDEMLNSNTFK